MMYTGYARLKSDASEIRLEELRQQLQRLNCTVRIDPEAERLEFELCNDDAMWATTGQLTLLLMTYNDVITLQRQTRAVDPNTLQA